MPRDSVVECGCPSAAFANGRSKPAHAFLPLPKGEGRGEGESAARFLWRLALGSFRCTRTSSRSGRSSAVSPSLAFNASSVSVTVESKAIPPMARNLNLIPCRAIASWSAAVLLPLSRTDEISQPMPSSLSPRERVGVRGNRPPDFSGAWLLALGSFR